MRKEKEVVDLSFNSLLAISRLLAHNSWLDIDETLEVYSQSEVSINPFMVDKAFLHLKNNFSGLDFEGKWRLIDDFRLKIEKWSQGENFYPKFIWGMVARFLWTVYLCLTGNILVLKQLVNILEVWLTFLLRHFSWFYIFSNWSWEKYLWIHPYWNWYNRSKVWHFCSLFWGCTSLWSTSHWSWKICHFSNFKCGVS